MPILYIFTVLVTVYQMRERGNRVNPAKILQAGGVQGWLHYRPAPVLEYAPSMQAFLTDGRDGKELLLCLTWARMRIDGLIHVAGTEYFLRGRKGRPERWPQSWVAAPPGQEQEAVQRIRSLMPSPPVAPRAPFADYESAEDGLG